MNHHLRRFENRQLLAACSNIRKPKPGRLASVIKLWGLLLLLLSGHFLYAQVPGCKDSLANNYNPGATINNGSCTYNVTGYTPIIKVGALNSVLTESSGLQMAGNFLWSFNDGGGEAAIYRIDTLTNKLLQTVKLAGAENIDWEDIAFDGTSFYIGDFGNNANGARTDLKVYKFPVAAIPAYDTSPIAEIPAQVIEIIRFSYQDQSQPPLAVAANQTAFDCEAMIVDGGKIHLFTKNWIALNTTHYVINSTAAGTYTASPVDTLATGYLVTAADKVPGENTIALLGYRTTGFGNHYLHLLTDFSGGFYFNGNKRRIDLPNALVMGQAEGICFRTPTYGYISNERVASLQISQRLYVFDISTFITRLVTTYTFSGNGNWDDPANWVNQLMPPASVTAGSEIIIDPPTGGRCILNIPYTLTAGATLTVKTDTNFIIQGNLVQH